MNDPTPPAPDPVPGYRYWTPRYVRHRWDSVDRSLVGGTRYVLVYRHHYGTEYYDAATREAIEASSLAVLRRLVDSGEFPADAEDPPPPAVTEEAARSLPPGAVRDLALREVADYKRELASAAEWRMRMADVSAALAAGDGATAYAALCDLCDPEVRLEPLQTGGK